MTKSAAGHRPEERRETGRPWWSTAATASPTADAITSSSLLPMLVLLRLESDAEAKGN